MKLRLEETSTRKSLYITPDGFWAEAVQVYFDDPTPMKFRNAQATVTMNWSSGGVDHGITMVQAAENLAAALRRGVAQAAEWQKLADDINGRQIIT